MPEVEAWDEDAAQRKRRAAVCVPQKLGVHPNSPNGTQLALPGSLHPECRTLPKIKGHLKTLHWSHGGLRGNLPARPFRSSLVNPSKGLSAARQTETLISPFAAPSVLLELGTGARGVA